MADNLVNIFDAPLGVNNVDDPKSDRFQPPSKEQPEKPFLTKAENVDLDRTGGLKTRQGRTKARVLTNAHSGWACELGAFYVDAGALYRFDPRTTNDLLITSGISTTNEVSYAEVAGQVFWCNGSEVGCVSGVQARPWGLRAADPPTLSATSGGLREGRYLVAVAPVSSDGIEGGCRAASAIDLRSTGVSGIQCGITGIDPNAAAINVYLSDTNGQDLFYHSTVPVGSFTITSPAPTTELFTGLGAYPPPAGHIVAQWGGFLVIARSEPSGLHALYFSEPGNPHRFHIETDVQLLPSRCVMLASVTDGFYYALEGGGTFFVSGSDPHNMKVRRVDDRLVSEQRNVLYVPAHKLPWLQAELGVPVPIWATQDGWAAGLPGGMVRYPVEGRVAMDATRQATMSYVERPGLKQLLMSARGQRRANQMAFGDRVTVTVTRGGEPTA